MLAGRPNEILHLDFCYIGKSSKGPCYVLILKDDFSSYVRFYPFQSAGSEETAEALMECFSSFGTVAQWVSDRGSHFKNEVIDILRKQMRGSHHFTLAYCPWTNGTVEVVCRELLRTIRALSSEFQVPFKLWPSLLPLVQSILNNTPLERLAGNCPLTAFPSLPAESPLLSIKYNKEGKILTSSISEIKARQIAEFGKIQSALKQMHKQVSGLSSRSRRARVRAHNSKTHVQPCNFYVGDFVLRGMSRKNAVRKLSLRWSGPYRVTRVLSEFLFEVEDLRTKHRTIVHGTRLKFFRNKSYEFKEDCIAQLAFQQNEYCLVSEFQDIRRHNGEVELLVKWQGFDDEQPGWENINAMKEDVPVLVKDFLDELRQTGTKRQKQLVSNLNF